MALVDKIPKLTVEKMSLAARLQVPGVIALLMIWLIAIRVLNARMWRRATRGSRSDCSRLGKCICARCNGCFSRMPAQSRLNCCYVSCRFDHQSIALDRIDPLDLRSESLLQSLANGF